jgi:hypothetical protein
MNLNIYQKLLTIRSELSVIRKDKKNPFFHSNYVDINSVLELIIPKLTEYNLLLLQENGIEDGKDVIVTRVIDTDTKDEISSVIDVKCPKEKDPQAFGSGITYSRRYAIISLFALEQTDDDGHKASGHKDFKLESELSNGYVVQNGFAGNEMPMSRKNNNNGNNNSSLPASQKQRSYLVTLLKKAKQPIDLPANLSKDQASKMIGDLLE